MPALVKESSKVLFGHILQWAPYLGSWFYIFGQDRRGNKNDVGLMVYQYLEILLLACHCLLFQAQKKAGSFSVKAGQWSIALLLFGVARFQTNL